MCLARMELILFKAAHIVLCFRLVTRTVLVTDWCFSYCWAVLAQSRRDWSQGGGTWQVFILKTNESNALQIYKRYLGATNSIWLNKGHFPPMLPKTRKSNPLGKATPKGFGSSKMLSAVNLNQKAANLFSFTENNLQGNMNYYFP